MKRTIVRLVHRARGCPKPPTDPPYDGYVWICSCGAHVVGVVAVSPWFGARKAWVSDR